MPGIVALVAAISTEVNSLLVSAKLPPLTDGQIVIGQVMADETVAPPRIVMVPRGSKFEARESPGGPPVRSQERQGAGLRSVPVSNGGAGYTAPTIAIDPPQLAGGEQATAVAIVQSGVLNAIALTSAGSGYTAPPNVTVTDTTGSGAVASALLGPTAQQLRQISQRAIFTDLVQFDCHCWGIALPSPGYDSDFDATQLLYQTLIAAAFRVAGGMANPLGGRWADAMQLDRAGHYYILGLEFRTPVLDAPLLFAPLGVQSDSTITAAPAGGTPQPT